MQDPTCELWRIPLPKLSEKGYEQRSGRPLGRYTGGERDQETPLRRLAGLCYRRVLDFSDNFSTLDFSHL